ncbi:hypothetical protein [Candidatus Scalindua japonica]|uniref:hypothetical protein n=1 Tax=Candidatus Scalindua japonica TaxID=1284222 RepID=UPI000BDE9992|nr:hypothetical protein [Candidatus Scalindua japonica]
MDWSADDSGARRNPLLYYLAVAGVNHHANHRHQRYDWHISAESFASFPGKKEEGLFTTRFIRGGDRKEDFLGCDYLRFDEEMACGTSADHTGLCSALHLTHSEYLSVLELEMKIKTVTIIVIVNLVAMILLAIFFPHLMIRPGKLIDVHAELATDCFAYHTPFIGSTSEKCTVCHKIEEIGKKTTNGLHISMENRNVAFHQKLIEENCLSCEYIFT